MRLLEIIIVDGGSENNTISRIKKFQEKISNVQLIIEKDNGPAQALNKALLLVKGEFIAWLNSDDKFEVNSFQRSLNYFDKIKIARSYMDMENILIARQIYRILSYF